jgi:hypothetical protein
MPFEGYLDAASETEIAGWVYHGDHANTPLSVEILADGNVVATLRADGFREDLRSAGKGDGNHAFRYSMPQGERSKSRLCARVVGQPWFLQLCTEAYSRAFAFMRHTCEYGIPAPPFGFSELPAPDPKTEISLANRLMAAYHRASQSDVKREKPEDQWTFLERAIFPDFIDIIQQRDATAFADYMRCFFARSISHGTFQGAMATAGLENPGSGASVAGRTMDALASLCESVGLLRVENPEQGHYGENLFREPDELIALLESFLKIDVVPPNAAGRKFGIRTRKGILALTDVRAIYAARRIQEIIGPVKRPSVCEIGGGIGGVAYYCNLLNIRNYTIIDLPAISVMQGYWLARALPDVPIVLFGEPDHGGPAIRLLPPSRYGKAKFDLVFNQDSFPEMHRNHSIEYLRRARRIAPAVLSINQEGENPQTLSSHQTVVSDLVAAVGGYRRIYRCHHWLRPGYVEELYAVQRRPMRVMAGHALNFVRKRLGR